jgi:subtilase family serine protease
MRIGAVATAVVCVGMSCVAVQATAHAADDTVRVSVDIGRDSAGLAALATAVSDPHNPRYRRFLTPQQVQATFGATNAQRAAVSAWLTSAGLKVSHVDPFTVTALGTAAQAGDAVASPLVASPAQVRAASRMTVPSSVASAVRSIHLSGQTPLRAKPMSDQFRATTTAHCSAYFGQLPATGLPDPDSQPLTYAPCGYEPAQLRSAYGLTAKGLTGKGVTVGIISPLADTTAVTDTNQWSIDNGVQQLVPGQFTQDIAAGAVQDEVGESPLDIEAVHGMAPDARIFFSVGDGTVTGSALLDALTKVVNTHAADIVTSSWGEGFLPDVDQSLIDAWDTELRLAAVEGITVDSASGDSGDKAGLQYPGADPMLTAVGGTSLAIGAQGQYLYEKPWEDDVSTLDQTGTTWNPAPPGRFSLGTTGGISQFPMPAYQQGVVTGNVVQGQAMRAVPDVSALADGYLGYPELQSFGTGFLTGVNGGTSLASPLVAAMEAAAIQARGGTPLGFVNPTLYALSGGPAFHDVTNAGQAMAFVNDGPVADGRTLLVTTGQCQENPTMTCGPGYDTTTGLGSPTPEFFGLLAR